MSLKTNVNYSIYKMISLEDTIRAKSVLECYKKGLIIVWMERFVYKSKIIKKKNLIVFL